MDQRTFFEQIIPVLLPIFWIIAIVYEASKFDFREYYEADYLTNLAKSFSLVFSTFFYGLMATMLVASAMVMKIELKPTSVLGMFLAAFSVVVFHRLIVGGYLLIIDNVLDAFSTEKRKNKPTIISTWGKNERTNALSDRHSNGSDGGLADEHAIMDGSDSRRNRGITS